MRIDTGGCFLVDCSIDIASGGITARVHDHASGTWYADIGFSHNITFVDRLTGAGIQGFVYKYIYPSVTEAPNDVSKTTNVSGSIGDTLFVNTRYRRGSSTDAPIETDLTGGVLIQYHYKYVSTRTTNYTASKIGTIRVGDVHMLSEDTSITETNITTVQAYTEASNTNRINDLLKAFCATEYDRIEEYNDFSLTGTRLHVGSLDIELATDFDSTEDYVANSLVYENSQLYRNTNAVTAGDFDSSEWTTVGSGIIHFTNSTISLYYGSDLSGTLVTTGTISIHDRSAIRGRLADSVYNSREPLGVTSTSVLIKFSNSCNT